jgi:hypothetical protein
MDAPELLTQEEAAARLLMRPETLTKWRYRCRGPRFCKYGGKIRYRLSDIERFIASGVVDPAKQKKTKRRRKVSK